MTGNVHKSCLYTGKMCGFHATSVADPDPYNFAQGFGSSSEQEHPGSGYLYYDKRQILALMEKIWIPYTAYLN